MATHSVTFLKDADLVVVLKDGQVSESGTYHELLRSKGAFAEFLMQHLKDSAEEDNLDDVYKDMMELHVELQVAVGVTKLRKQLSHISQSSQSSGSKTESMDRINLRGNSQEGSQQFCRRKSSHQSEREEKSSVKLIEDEGMEEGNVKFQVFFTYMKSFGAVRLLTCVALFMTFHGLSFGGNFWLADWTDNKDMKNASLQDFIPKRDKYLGVYGVFGVSQSLACLAAVALLTLSTIAASGKIHMNAFHRVMRSPMSFFDSTPMGRTLNRFSRDVDVIDNMLPGTLQGFLWIVILIIGTLVTISYNTPLFLSVIVPVVLFYIFVQRMYVASSRQLKRLEAVSRSPIYSHFSETIAGASSIRAFGKTSRFIAELQERVDANQTCYFPVAVSSTWAGVRLDTLGTFLTFFAALFSVLGRGSIEAGIVGVSVTYALSLIFGLNVLMNVSTQVENCFVSVERLKEYSEMPQQEAEWEDGPNGGAPPSWPSQGNVQFQGYATRYREGLDLVLRGINLNVKGGEKIGIVGRTGAGKSSLALGLFRLVEAAAGRILIDGVDISKLGLHTLRSRLTIIPQDPVLFCGSLRINVDPFEQFSDQQLWRALERAHLKELVQGFPAGLNHEIAEGGENLSVGQRQLVCLARALLRKTKVLVFDEATAAVDLKTDDLIQETIRSDFKECTIFTITHRLNTVLDSDKVLVLDQGQIKEFDHPEVLLERRDSLFYGLAKDAGLVRH